MSILWHQLLDFARLLGLRDRLRCPECGAIGTYKPHGGWLDFGDARGIRRWICKWCGFYRDGDGTDHAVLGRGQWELRRHYPAGDTPKQRCRGANPWAG